MRGKQLSAGLRATLIIFTVTLFVASAAAATAPTEKVLYNFKNNNKDGVGPYAGLIRDSAGNLYGTTLYGGIYGGGSVFELSPRTGGGWTEKILHNFDNTTLEDGYSPYGNLVLDASGNLYGTTVLGGNNSLEGLGTVFELKPKTGGGWTEQILYNFGNNATDAVYPYAGLILDSSGNLYGTTSEGGSFGYGTVFELSLKAGSWTETILYNFDDNGTDGINPYGSLIFDSTGNLYGTTGLGGVDSEGTVFELTLTAGTWTETVLHSFSETDGYEPFANVIFDSAGNLYGTTLYGGVYDYGTVFELASVSGSWTETTLHSFNDNFTDGYFPGAGLIIDSAGNLYGTTTEGGVDGYGMVFELKPKAGGGWTETVLHNFNDNGKDGFYPYAGLIFDASGNLYGTTSSGGVNSEGTVFEVMP